MKPTSDLIHVYFIPGMAAGKEIFKYISLPEDRFKVHIIEWLIPEKKETLEHYAARMAALVQEEHPVLVGVSFGGVVAQEMSRYLNPRKTIIISSVKSKYELPWRLRILRKTRAYKLAPTRVIAQITDYRKLAFNDFMRKKLSLYNQYLQVKNPRYLEWAIQQMVCWDRKEIDEQVIHIHGDRDPVFPIQYIQNSIPVAGATHVLILSKAKWLNKKLPKLILS